ncbi:hypothetical protein [Vibrio rumoiensis]|uniref:Uncharacterized protein n=1 Tax=Vibrio rumoiensis TaxID=76258 RepID=A0ABW7J0B9_9VIBR
MALVKYISTALNYAGSIGVIIVLLKVTGFYDSSIIVWLAGLWVLAMIGFHNRNKSDRSSPLNLDLTYGDIKKSFRDAYKK